MTFLLEVSLHQLWSLLWELISAGASIQNLQFGWAGSSEYMTTGIIAVGFGEAIAGYPCLIDQMALQGIIHSRAFSLDLGGVDTQSGMSTASVMTRQQTFSIISQASNGAKTFIFELHFSNPNSFCVTRMLIHEGSVLFGGIDTKKFTGALSKRVIIDPSNAPDGFLRFVSILPFFLLWLDF
jgi:hypothetical protein